MSASLPSIDRYALEAELGSGGFGAVYRARHLVLGRVVALKVLHPQRATDATIMQRFLREARAVAQLRSPNIVEVLDADTTSDGRAFIAMELLEGEDLAARLGRGRMQVHEVIRLGRGILAALAVAHANGVVHRDLKPGNIFLAKSAGEPIPKVLDFGISKVRTESPEEELTRTGTMLGTPHYMAPEQFHSSKDVDGRADLFSLGVVLYEALAGQLPHQGETLHQLIATKLTQPPPPLTHSAPHVPHAVGEVVLRALDLDPARRYASAQEMDAALASVETRVSAPGVSLPPRASVAVSVPPAPRSKSRVLPWVLGIGGVLALGVLGLLALALVGAFLAEQRISAWSSTPPASVAPAYPSIPPPPAYATPAPTPAPAPLPTAPAPAPLPTARPHDIPGVHIHSTTLGAVDSSAVETAAQSARAGLARCRGASRHEEQVQFVVGVGGVLMPSGMPSHDPTHECIVDAIRASGPVRSIATGIARFDVTLDPR